MTAFCTQCSKGIPDDSRFCPFCRAPLASTTQLPMQSDDAWYEQAFDEQEKGQTVKAAWARALVESNGDEARTRVAYIRLRVMQLKAANEAEQIAKVEAERTARIEAEADRRNRALAEVKDGEAAYKRGDYATVLRLSQSLAEQGHAGAQNNLGAMYADGKGVPQNRTEAVKWFQLAADQGHADSQFRLGMMGRRG